MSFDRAASSLLDNDLSLFQLEGFSTPQHGARDRRVGPSQLQRMLGMMQSALQHKSVAYDRAMEELMRCRDELVATKRCIAEMSRAELDSGILREEVERLIMAKCTLAKDKAELERETQLLWLERELVFDQLQADPESSNSLCGVVEEKLQEVRQAEGLHEQLQEALRGRRRLAEELAALRTHHRKCRALWQRQERMLLRVLQVQAQLSSRGVRAPNMPPLASGMPIKRASPCASVKMLSHPFPRLHHPHNPDFSSLSSDPSHSQGMPAMPGTPPAATPGTLSRIERAFEALEMGTTRPYPAPTSRPIPRPIPSYSLLDSSATAATTAQPPLAGASSSSSSNPTPLPPSPPGRGPQRLNFDDEAGPPLPCSHAPQQPKQQQGKAQEPQQEASEVGSISFTGPASTGTQTTSVSGVPFHAAGDPRPASSVGECGVRAVPGGRESEDDCCSSAPSAHAVSSSSSS